MISSKTNGRVAWVLFILASFLSVSVHTAATGCSAQITLNSTYPGSAFYIYYDIIVANTGACALSRVFVSIILPPNLQPFAYYNISNETGELLGITHPMPSGSVEEGGTIVLNSARVPEVTLLSVECNTTCNPTVGTPAPSTSQPELPTIKVRIQPGSNDWWFGLSLDSGASTRRVHFRDAKSASWVRMSSENWGAKNTFTYSAAYSGLALPLSLQLASSEGETIVLEDIISTFVSSTVDTNVTYQNATVTRPVDTPTDIDTKIELDVQPDSNSQWIGLVPRNSRFDIITISVKAQNADWVDLESSTGIFELSTPGYTMDLPISIRLTSAEQVVLEIDNLITSFDSQTISTGLQF